MAEIEETSRKMDENLKRSFERMGSSVARILTGARRTSLSRPITTATLVVLGMIGILGSPLDAFKAYHCMNQSNIVELYLLLEPDACAASDGSGESRLPCMGD
jgi:hypothetical protein